ncbi:hypothetical protein TPHA_0A00800 [Tetrapisispora phaffii CBS 4417]|uniref:RNA exonuclease 4 n=1 Tax=Tetrapisispora phaffii (strain ATCC 24235 / CBS 4417 / NBRC 1672 / NRRL Y-8282 / UCD 70-5) TaxID=1071381 RepID=G8BMN7_TETPH|nr:hypothetical protein TPHA_0A00800 [Tetrapisispora phaffii CBS 4417]CCE61165.1 hypothetical protein TPHA_0A00800 [Tetrapisispora phaffii CBS 4417]
MALSSNWLELQKTKKVIVKKQKKVIKPSWKIEGNKKRKGSKIMDMVYAMNEEIDKSKEHKKNGTQFQFKVETEVNTVLDEKLKEDISDTRASSIGKYIAIDCEFVGIGPEGKESALARVSLVNYYGHVLFDAFVQQREPVTDWRTWVSGIKPEHMRNAIPFELAQKKVFEILDGRILVGHAVKHDLEALFISHPKSMIRDTSRHLPFRQKYSKGKAPSLKKLAKELFKIDVQDGQHSSVEDAKTTMLIYKSDKKEFERLHKNNFSK